MNDPNQFQIMENCVGLHNLQTKSSKIGYIMCDQQQNSAIQLQGNNRVLKKRPPPISDEEQRLNQRQRCTLSQLRSGHCHLFQDYKHRVLGEPSDICTYCGASPQDVRHLFACTTHPTDLSPEDLWRILWDQFLRLAISTTETLTALKTNLNLVVANNNSKIAYSIDYKLCA